MKTKQFFISIFFFLLTIQVQSKDQFELSIQKGLSFYDNNKKGSVSRASINYNFHKYFKGELFMGQNFAHKTNPFKEGYYSRFLLTENNWNIGIEGVIKTPSIYNNILEFIIGIAYNKHKNNNNHFEVFEVNNHKMYDYVKTANSGTYYAFTPIYGAGYNHLFKKTSLGIRYYYQPINKFKKYGYGLTNHEIVLMLNVKF